MKKIFMLFLLVMVLLIFTSIYFSLKEKFLEIKIAKINKEIYDSYGELQSLKAEWHYLNNKEYLKSMVDKHIPELKVQQKFTNSDDLLSKLP